MAWLGGAAIGVVNGTLREVVYRDHVSELTAHQISSATAIGLFAMYFWQLDRRWPLPSTRAAFEVGCLWVILTLLFEFGLGRLVTGSTSSELLRQYDVTSGYVWTFVLLWLGVGPAVVRVARRRRRTS